MSDFLPPDQRSIFYQDSAAYYRNKPLSPEQQKKLYEQQQEQMRQEEYKRRQFYQQQQQQQQQSYQQQAQNVPAGLTVRLEPTPYATSAMVCGILSLLFTVIWLKWYGTIVGLILACLTLYMTNNGTQMIETSPHVFSQSGKGSLRTAKILGIISLSLAAFSFIFLVLYFTLVSETADSGRWEW